MLKEFSGRLAGYKEGSGDVSSKENVAMSSVKTKERSLFGRRGVPRRGSEDWEKRS